MVFAATCPGVPNLPGECAAVIRENMKRRLNLKQTKTNKKTPRNCVWLLFSSKRRKKKLKGICCPRAYGNMHIQDCTSSFLMGYIIPWRFTSQRNFYFNSANSLCSRTTVCRNKRGTNPRNTLLQYLQLSQVCLAKATERVNLLEALSISSYFSCESAVPV